MSENYVYVHIGEVKVGNGNDVLHALLGSCVGIALLCPSKDIYGLAHCLLPKSPKGFVEIGARYVDQAIASLIKLMDIRRCEYADLKAVVAGGGNMTKPKTTKEEDLIGSINVNEAIECLEKMGITIIYKDVGGQAGRKMSLCCASEKFEINSISRNNSL